ncbi:apiosidase-like domain-containing protein [Isoptericola sp. NPDC055881]
MTVTRRQFLALAGLATGGAALAACSRDVPPPALPSAAVQRWAAASGAVVHSVSPDRRHLVDEQGTPVLVLADTVWTMPAVYDEKQLARYFRTRRSQGFNGLQTSALPFHIDGDNRVDGCADGQQAFLDGDITRWDEGYWQRLDRVLQAASAHGTSVVLGAMGPLVSYGLDDLDQCRGYGRLLGERYGDAPGIVWLFGVDYARADWDRLDPLLLACLDGIRDAGDAHPATVQFHNDASLSADNPRWRGRADVQAAYTYAPADEVVSQGYALDQGPVVLAETNFEDENNTGGPATTPASIRRQALWTLTSGGVQVAYGRKSVWRSQGDFLGDLESSSVAQLGLVRARFEALDWAKLVPDLAGAVLLAGAGAAATQGSQLDGTADPLESDHATCAADPDGALAVVYVPSAREVRLAAPYDVGAGEWWDPSTGETHEAGRATDGTFAPPDRTHADGQSDWLLVVRPAR